MPTDLYGATFAGYREVARKIITIGAAKPFYKLTVDDNNRISYLHGNEKVALNFPGFYVIYRQQEGELEPLYSGYSSAAICNRIYRFMKELQGRSRPDESHPAARKMRRYGVKPTDVFLVKALSKEEIPDYSTFYYELDKVDECIAYLLKTKYNNKVIYA